MLPTQRTTLMLALAMVGVLVTAVGAVTGRDWDQAGVLGLVLLLLGVAVAGLRRHRDLVRLRPDLAGWVRERAAATGEPAERVVDRAVAAHRAGLYAPVEEP